MEQLELRLLILLIGAVILVALFFWGMRHHFKRRLKERQRRQGRGRINEPVLDNEQGQIEASSDVKAAAERAMLGENQNGHNDVADEEDFASRSADIVERMDAASNSASTASVAATNAHNKVNVVLLILAEQGELFQGDDLLDAFRALELRLNDKGVWDCHVDGEARDEPVFGIGHLQEPGQFDLAAMTDMETPGILLFMTLPGPVTATTAVELMIKTADRLVERIGGIVCDQQGRALTATSLTKLRSEAAAFDRQ